jgi:ankyrin repeat protein
MKNFTGRVPLHEACIGGHADVVALLLDHISDLEITDKNKHTAMHHAAYNGEAKCLKLMAAKGNKMSGEKYPMLLSPGRDLAYLWLIKICFLLH